MASRVPIPRLPIRHKDQKSRRTSRACDECRARKSKCDGARPICSQCASAGLVECVYSESKRTQERQQLELANREIDRYHELLQDIYQEVDASVAKKITNALRHSARGEASSPYSVSPASSVGSLDALDTVNEDVNRSKESRATGYLGKSSEVAWMRSLEPEARDQPGDERDFENSESPQLPIDDSISSVNYHIEPVTYPGLEDNDPYALPPKALADRLLQLYLESVQPSLPVIRQDLFTDQFKSLYSGESINPGRKWLAVLNLIFAISSRLCRLSGQDIQNRDLQFFSRAQTLNISESVVEDHEDLQQVQVETLAAFYLLTSSHVNRAWKMIGTATRSGIALGLHLRATHNKLNASDLEARHKLWWTIFILETLLSVKTGRASGLGNSFCSAPPPLASDNTEYSSKSTPQNNLERPSENPRTKWTIHHHHERLEDQRAWMRFMDPTNALYFFCLVDLVRISHTSSTRVYNPDAVNQGWNQVQSRIDFYNRKMEEWRSSLPESMSFEEIGARRTIASRDTYRVSLAMHYYSSRIILNRPCLARPKGGGRNGIKLYGSHSGKETATACLHSALALLSVFPNQPDLVWAYYLPWWNILHFLVQATTILLINISLEPSPSKRKRSPGFTSDSSADQSPDSSQFANSETIVTATKKALQWLYCLGKTDESAHRAFELCSNYIRRIAPGRFDLDELDFANIESKAPSMTLTADQTHQQHRSRVDVPYSQFAGTRDFGYDGSTGIGRLRPELEATEGFGAPQYPSLGVLGEDVDMSDYVPHPEDATLDEILLSLVGPDNQPR